MAQLRLSGDPEIEVVLRRNAHARQLCLRVSRLDRRVTLTLPKAASRAEAQSFARQKEQWIRRQLSNALAPVIPRIGGTILFEGQVVPILAGRGRVVRLVDGQFHVPGGAKIVPPRIASYLKFVARQKLSAACRIYCDALEVAANQITLRDTRSRWGSCTSAGNLMFSWRLIMAPADVLTYVAAHEVAHLVELNHGQDYWAALARIRPDYETPRRWLCHNGAQLHSYRFSQLTGDGGRDHIE